ncbi:hypothetical protein REPUB_Repub02eG0219800 [Reevesia pubescens]
MAIADEIVNKLGMVQASSNFALQRGERAPASFERNTFNELADCVIFDSVQQCNGIHSAVGWNFINELPDHILVSILSLLNLKEAARTSLLSHRWRNLWTFTSRLVFDDSLMAMAMQREKVVKSLEVERSRFINWVDNTLKFHQKREFKPFIWILDVQGDTSLGEVIHLQLNFFLNYSINSLKVLRLIAVEVSGEVVDYVLSACPLLEVLSVRTSKSLPQISSITYCGRRVIAAINNVPCLMEASISGYFAPFLVKNICQFSGLLSQLETLVLYLTLEIFRRFPKFPKLKNLKHLEQSLNGYHAHSLLHCAKLFNVSPLLHRFTVKVQQLDCMRMYRKVKEQETEQPHRRLKVIEFIGFVGCAVDIELLLCLLKRAVSLEKLMIDPCAGYHFGERFECGDLELLLSARSQAKQLETRLPPSAELVIL